MSDFDKNAAEQLMQLAIDQAVEGVAAGQSPFGCAISWEGKVIAATHNSVLANLDITAHAEIQALRMACKEAGGILLPGAMVASTCEPCPMCMSALHWARVETVYYGASIADAREAEFNELSIPAADIVRLGKSSVQIVSDVLRDKCRELFYRWEKMPNRRSY